METETITFMSSLIFACNSMIVRSLVSSVSRRSLFFFLSSANNYVVENLHTSLSDTYVSKAVSWLHIKYQQISNLNYTSATLYFNYKLWFCHNLKRAVCNKITIHVIFFCWAIFTFYICKHMISSCNFIVYDNYTWQPSPHCTMDVCYVGKIKNTWRH